MAHRTRRKTARVPVQVDDTHQKEAIYEHIADSIQQKVGGRKVGREFAKNFFESQIEMVFSYAIHGGLFRFPRGLGTLTLKMLAPTTKVLPNGERVEIHGERPILKYHEGLSVRAALGKPDKYPGRVKPVRETLLEPPPVPADLK